MSESDELAQRWRAARPPVAGLHLDSAACSRQSFAVIDAPPNTRASKPRSVATSRLRPPTPVLDAGRAAVAVLSGMPDAEVVFTTGSLNALDLLLGSWPADEP